MLASRMVKEGDGTKLRDLLYLDLGLEAQLRLMAERSLGNTPYTLNPTPCTLPPSPVSCFTLIALHRLRNVGPVLPLFFVYWYTW
jgi:hypothetical protein